MFSLDYRDSKPIYEQIKDRFRTLIISGVIEEGERMPSVRSLASSLSVNPNTIQRAYRELEQEGYLLSIPGKGSIATHSKEADQHRKEELFREIRKNIRELRNLSVTEDELLQLLKEDETVHD
jgi:GntR family transcriptional regulator